MKNRLLVPALTAIIALPACGGTAAKSGTTPSKHSKVVDIRKAAMPYKVLVAAGGKEIPRATMFAKLADAQAVCVGEAHPNPHHHWAQLAVFTELSNRAKQRGAQLALGMEMFQRPFQGVLDDYRAAKISEREMLSRTAWKKRWGYDYRLYKPMIRLAVRQGHTLLALNTAKELIKKVSRQGLDVMSAEDKAKLPQLELDDKQHREWWRKLMGGLGGAAGHSSPHKGKAKHHHAHRAKKKKHPSKMSRAERIYSAQVTWDETMADTATKWLKGGQGRQIVILAGNGHCHESAIVRRMKRRGIERVVSIHPIVDTGDGEVGELLAAPINDYLLVMMAEK